MATTDELIKQLRDRAKSDKRGFKTAAKAFVKDAKPLTAELCGIEVKCPKCGSDNYVKDGDGSVLLDQLFKPLHRKKWSRAEQVNNITYDQVEKEKPFSFYKDKIQKIFDDAELLIAYNDPFDVSFLEVNGIDLAGKKQFDVMLKFNEVLKDGRKHKLTYCADWYRFNWQEDQHTSLRDVKATLYYFNEMVK